MWTHVCKSFEFDAAHHLPRMPDGHKCKRQHGHTYHGEVEFHGVPDADGILVEYGRIQAILDEYDHQDLNVLLDVETTTTEYIAAHIFKRMKEAFDSNTVHVVRVRLNESSTTWAEVTGR
jgi:6-pyruvoyltetrahydropterin/6-carboxytetrahydropterin synthase